MGQLKRTVQQRLIETKLCLIVKKYFNYAKLKLQNFTFHKEQHSQATKKQDASLHTGEILVKTVLNIIDFQGSFRD